MNIQKYIYRINNMKFLMVITTVLSLSACGGSDDDSSGEGYVKRYNTVNNSD
jgi:hypothetical protein